ncbi:MAG: sigma-70 family RNA polymerase sigma factor [Solirubrobacteraceae bacterium]|nr:sigma-70 family RNA polymerase sigma factor [Solirubrobacteraceae bacterium]
MTAHGRRRRFVVDADSLDRLYREHSQRLLVFLARRLLDPNVAVDLVAETFAAAFAARRTFRGTTEDDAVGWLFGIARNQLLMHLRRDGSRTRALRRVALDRRELTDSELERIEELADLARLRAEVREALPALCDEHRTAIRLRVIEELEYSEIAERLRVSEQTARARVSRGLRALSGLLEARS